MYTTNPRENPKYIQTLKTSLESRESGQTRLDEQTRDLILQRHVIEGKAPESPDIQFKPVGTGYAGLMADQDISVLLGDITWRVYPRGGAKAEDHASDRLEPFISSAFSVMQEYHETWPLMVQDAVTYGRFWGIGPLPAPSFWGDDTIRKMYERLEDAEDENKPGVRGEISEYKAGNFPIVWRQWDSINVKATWSDRGEPSEVLYLRKMYAAQIVERWGDSALPDRKRSVGPVTMGTKGYKDDEELDVIEYVNGTYVASVIPAGDDTRVPHQWEHHMHCTPVTFGDCGRLGANPYGWRWKGAVFNLRELIPSIDEAMSDWRTLIREAPTSPFAVFLDAEQRASLEGWPLNLQIKAGETANFLKGEELRRGPMPEINPALLGYINVARDLAHMGGARREALGGPGLGPSGQSAVHLNEANQIAKAELKRAHLGLQRGLTRAVRLLLKSVPALSEEFPEAPDEVVVRPALPSKSSKEIAVTPEDVRGWGHLVEANIDLNLPIDQGQQALIYKSLTESLGLDHVAARQSILRIENPQEVDRRRREWQWEETIAQLATNVLTARAGGALEAATVDEGQLREKFSRLPQFAQEVFTRFGDNGNAARGFANQQRTGAQQQMSQLQGTQTVLP